MATLINEITKSQCAAILAHMETKGPITKLEALKQYDCMHLGGRICDLRKSGHDIKTVTIAIKSRGGKTKRIAQYHLDKKAA